MRTGSERIAMIARDTGSGDAVKRLTTPFERFVTMIE
jgi:hypothetical protein